MQPSRLSIVLAMAALTGVLFWLGLYLFQDTTHMPWETAYPTWTWIKATGWTAVGFICALPAALWFWP